MTFKKIQIDFDKIAKHDQEFIYEMLTDYIIEYELPEDYDNSLVFSYSIDVGLGLKE